MNDNGFLYNLERAQAGPVDEEALARKMAARAARVARAHESVFTEANGWSGQFPGTPGYYYFADSDEGQYVIVEAIGEDEGLEIYYSGSEIAFPPEGMDGKWKARSRALRVFAGEGLRRKKPLGETALPSQAQNIYNRTWQSEKFSPLEDLPSVSSSFSNGSERLKAVYWEPAFYAFELNDSSP